MAEDKSTEDSFSYEGDVKPLMRRYFNISSGLSGPTATAFFKNRQQILEGETAKTLELQTRSLGFETAKLELEKARDDAANKRNMLESLQPFQQQIDSILEDTSIDSAERKRQIGIVGVRNAGLLATNDAAAKAYGAAQLGVGDDTNKKLTIFDYVRSGGDPKYLSEINPDVTKIDINQEINPAWMLDRLNKSGISKERQKNALEQETKRQNEVKSTIDSLVSGLNTVKLAKPQFGQEGEVADVFEDEGSAFKVSSVVEALGSEEDIAKFKETPSAKAQWDIARQIGHNYMKVKVGGGTNTPTQPNASSLYTSSKPKPEPNISPFITQ
jgi:hypothetical protein